MPVAGRVAWWGTALLRGHIGPDEFTDGLGEEYVAHVMPHATPESLLRWLLVLRGPTTGTTVAAAFPTPGDPAGLGGPAAFTRAATDAGEAVLTVGQPGDGLGLVPAVVGRAVEWSVHRADRRPPPDLGDADRALRAALLTAADALARLDVATWRPEVADELQSLRRGTSIAAPPGTPERAVDLAGRALHLWAVTDVALADDGGAVSAAEAAARRDAVLPLARAARHAFTAACSPDGWPPDPADADR